MPPDDSDIIIKFKKANIELSKQVGIKFQEITDLEKITDTGLTELKTLSEAYKKKPLKDITDNFAILDKLISVVLNNGAEIRKHREALQVIRDRLYDMTQY